MRRYPRTSRCGTLVWTAVLAGAASAAVAQVPTPGPEFQVNVTTAGDQAFPAVATESDNGFVLVWRSGASVVGRRFDSSGAPRSGEFVVNVAPADVNTTLAVAAHPSGGFLVTWTAPEATGDPGVYARHYDAAGQPTGAPFLVHAPSAGMQFFQRVAGGPPGYMVIWFVSGGSLIQARRFSSDGTPATPDLAIATGSRPDVAFRPGGFVATWQAPGSPGFTEWVKLRAFGLSGTPLGPEIVLNGPDPPVPPIGFTSFHRGPARIAAAADGSSVVTWGYWRQTVTGGFVPTETYILDYGSFARRVDASLSPLGPEFQLNVHDPGMQGSPAVAVTSLGRMFFTWVSSPTAECISCPPPPPQDGSGSGVYGRAYDAAGIDVSGEFRVNAATVGNQFAPSVAAAGETATLAVWQSENQDGSGYGIFARLFGSPPTTLLPARLEADPTDEFYSDGNGVFENWEAAVIAPSWLNPTGAPQAATSTASGFTGPPGSAYDIVIGNAAYGSMPPGATVSCQQGGQCFLFSVYTSTRPADHWDAQFTETISGAPALPKTWTLHVGDSFLDVPRSSFFYRFAETVFHRDVMTPCAARYFCPTGVVSRQAMALFVLKAASPGFVPPACVAGTERFLDMPYWNPHCPWVEELARRGVVTGCGGGNYCPTDPVNRQTLPVYLLVTRSGTGYAPPACTVPIFDDVPASSPFCRWIEELARRGVVAGCAPGLYCPAPAVVRDQMSVFLTGTFGLVLYGP